MFSRRKAAAARRYTASIAFCLAEQYDRGACRFVYAPLNGASVFVLFFRFLFFFFSVLARHVCLAPRSAPIINASRFRYLVNSRPSRISRAFSTGSVNRNGEKVFADNSCGVAGEEITPIVYLPDLPTCLPPIIVYRGAKEVTSH